MDVRALLMGLTFAFIWSSAFTAARIVVTAVPPLYALSGRFLLAGVCGILLALSLGQTARLTRSQWISVIVFGVCQNALYLGLNFVGMQTVEASLAAIVGSTMPLLVALFGWLILGERPRPLGIAGLVAGMVGVAIIMAGRISGGVDPWGLFLLCLGALALTAATLAVRGTSGGGNLLMVVGLQMLVGTAVLLPIALVTEPFHLDGSPRVLMAFLYMVFVPGLFATWLWFRLVLRIGAVKAATFHFLNPFFGVAVAAVLLGEPVHGADLVGVLIIMAGILAVQLSKQIRTRPVLAESQKA
ncbi:peptide ABC transporter permease [Haematobacter missouriensis]|uniref:EamA/RhaT family transporter n=1 Tax=Haematobacter missouriensis TaxID=366616 RepID=A0A212AW18_9RHOB|nr:DMT family transporter [Haematobacter missouriensis]KFI33728.1 peptide ABC transporter permease [Haematobacter missouriensis]OWJ77661.1 EamA/RhaT family transporter [Haematobacter missouriensis]OWJ85661.1 EamA/RhaT family transporter [Haematobacter missouriensis]